MTCIKLCSYQIPYSISNRAKQIWPGLTNNVAHETKALPHGLCFPFPFMSYFSSPLKEVKAARSKCVRGRSRCGMCQSQVCVCPAPGKRFLYSPISCIDLRSACGERSRQLSRNTLLVPFPVCLCVWGSVFPCSCSLAQNKVVAYRNSRPLMRQTS